MPAALCRAVLPHPWRCRGHGWAAGAAARFGSWQPCLQQRDGAGRPQSSLPTEPFRAPKIRVSTSAFLLRPPLCPPTRPHPTSDPQPELPAAEPPLAALPACRATRVRPSSASGSGPAAARGRLPAPPGAPRRRHHAAPIPADTGTERTAAPALPAARGLRARICRKEALPPPPFRAPPPAASPRPAAPVLLTPRPPGSSFVAAGARRRRMGAAEAPELSSGRLLPPPASRAPPGGAQRSAAIDRSAGAVRGERRCPGLRGPAGPLRGASALALRPRAAGRAAGCGSRPDRPAGSFGRTLRSGLLAHRPRSTARPHPRSRAALRGARRGFGQTEPRGSRSRGGQGCQLLDGDGPGPSASTFLTARPRGTFPLGVVGRRRGGAAPGADGRTERRSTAGGLGGSARC